MSQLEERRRCKQRRKSQGIFPQLCSAALTQRVEQLFFYLSLCLCPTGRRQIQRKKKKVLVLQQLRVKKKNQTQHLE